jgi:hypothetical protein
MGWPEQPVTIDRKAAAMGDTISRYRSVRLTLHLPPDGTTTARWTLLRIGVRRGVPTSDIIADGTLRFDPAEPTYEAITEALHAAVGQLLL